MLEGAGAGPVVYVMHMLDYYSQRIRDLRREASETRDPGSRRMMLGAAQAFEKLAAIASKRNRRRNASSHMILTPRKGKGPITS